MSNLHISGKSYFAADSAFFKRIGLKRGRPKKDEQLERGYLIEAEVQQNEAIIELKGSVNRGIILYEGRAGFGL